jgi:catechol 2,3-dioxygenase-like lactoylglutathione lyase family enzyme
MIIDGGNAMPLTRLDHCSIRTVKLEETRRFYADIMGLVEGDRPPFPFPGAWMYRDGAAVVHIVGIDPDDPEGLRAYLGDRGAESMTGTGTIDHIAFTATDLADMHARLRAHGVAWRDRTVPSLGLHQVFVEDPNGVTIELNYPYAESPQG